MASGAGFRAIALAGMDASPRTRISGLNGPTRPTALEYQGSTQPLQDVWIAVRANLRAILDGVTLADIASGKLPPVVRKLTRDPAAWE